MNCKMLCYSVFLLSAFYAGSYAAECSQTESEPRLISVTLLDRAGKEVGVTHFKSTRRDPLTKNLLLDHMTWLRGSPGIVALVHQASKTKKSRTRRELVAGPVWHDRQPEKHPITQRFMVRSPRYYIIEPLSDGNFVGRFLGTEKEAGSTHARGDLLRSVFYTVSDSLDSHDLIKVGNRYLALKEYAIALIWHKLAEEHWLAFEGHIPHVKAALCRSYLKTGAFEKAVACGLQAKRTYLEDYKRHNSTDEKHKICCVSGDLGRAYSALGQWEKVIEMLRECCDPHKGFTFETTDQKVKALNCLGYAYEQNGRILEALRCYTDAIEFDYYPGRLNLAILPYINILCHYAQNRDRILSIPPLSDTQTKLLHFAQRLLSMPPEKMEKYQEKYPERCAIALQEAHRIAGTPMPQQAEPATALQPTASSCQQ